MKKEIISLIVSAFLIVPSVCMCDIEKISAVNIVNTKVTITVLDSETNEVINNGDYISIYSIYKDVVGQAGNWCRRAKWKLDEDNPFTLEIETEGNEQFFIEPNSKGGVDLIGSYYYQIDSEKSTQFMDTINNQYARLDIEDSTEKDFSLYMKKIYIKKNEEPIIPIEKKDILIYGDVDADDTVDLSDLTMMSQYLLKDIEFDADQIACADVNLDDEINLQDLALMKQYVMNDNVQFGADIK